MDLMLWIRARLLPAYCITGFITVSGLIGVVTNVFLENYYHQMHELTLNLLPKWLRQFRLYVLWSARIGSILFSWTVLLHCFTYATSPFFYAWVGFAIILAVIEVIILLNSCDVFSKTLPKEATHEDRILYNRSVEHALYAIGSPIVTLLFMVVMTVFGFIKIW